jgi:signal transduction histidine kinase
LRGSLSVDAPGGAARASSESLPQSTTAPTGLQPRHGSLRRLFERLPRGIIGVRWTLEVDYLNPAAELLVPGVRQGALLPEAWPSLSLRGMAGSLFGASEPAAEIVETPSGQLISVEGIPAVEGESAVLLLEDVTTRERRLQAETQFASNAAHELRTPVAGIVSAVEVLQAGAKENRFDRDMFLQHIEREGERLARLVKALLLLTRLQSGEESPSLELVELAPLLEEVAAALNPAPGVTVSFSCGDDVAALAHPDLLRQAVWNVAANAVAHTSAGEISLTARGLERAAQIEVRDTGTGMPRADQKRAFERFFRAEPRSGDGAGLGLAIAKDVVRVLGGTISLESRPGVGTTVSLRVPLARLVKA